MIKNKRKHHGAVDKHSSEQLPLLCEKTGAIALAQLGLNYGRQADKVLLHLEIFKIMYWMKHENFSGIQKVTVSL